MRRILGRVLAAFLKRSLQPNNALDGACVLAAARRGCLALSKARCYAWEAARLHRGSVYARLVMRGTDGV